MLGHLAVTERQRRGLADQFVTYLLHRQTFRQTMNACVALVGNDRALRRAIKQALSEFIGNMHYMTQFRPALLRHAAGDPSLARRLGIIDQVREAARRQKRTVLRAAVNASFHRVDMIGPRHAEAMELGVLNRTRSHASKFAYRRAKFLGYAENGKEHRDVVQDMRCIAMRCFRWYYPFRGGTHMDNTVRSTITNRGLSYVKHHTRQCRQRMQTDENGVTTNVEAHDEFAMERFVDPRVNEERDAVLRIDMERFRRRGGVVGHLARVITDPLLSEGLLNWLNGEADVDPGVPARRTSDDVTDAVRLSGRRYESLLAEYLGLRESSVSAALETLRMAA